MLPKDAEVEHLLANEREALTLWFDNFMVVGEDGMILAGGFRPSYERIGVIFDQWVEHRKADLRHLICDSLDYKTLTSTQRDVGQITLVALVVAALNAASAPLPVDPVATAALLVTRQGLDRLCND